MKNKIKVIYTVPVCTRERSVINIYIPTYFYSLPQHSQNIWTIFDRSRRMATWNRIAKNTPQNPPPPEQKQTAVSQWHYTGWPKHPHAKKKTIRPTAVQSHWEGIYVDHGISQHQTPQTSRHYRIGGLKSSLIMPRDGSGMEQSMKVFCSPEFHGIDPTRRCR